ncbi:MAG: DUF881 domain-containing protein [Bacillota bacterium]
MNKKSMYISISVVTIILGFMLAIQFRTTRYADQSVPADRAQELVAEQSRLEKDNASLDREIEDLSYKLEQARKGQSEAGLAVGDELKKAKLAAGLISVQGPGVEVVLENPSSPNGKMLNFIRDEDLLKITNELKGAGAEAISINGQRLISTSEIRLAGSFININLERTEPPYQILAVGNPEKLKSSLEISGGPVDYFRNLGIVVNIRTHSLLTVPGYGKSIQYQYVAVKG